MRTRTLLVLSGLVLGAAACAGVETGAPPSTPPMVPVAPPAPIENYDWLSYIEGDQASLAFGLDESDDVWLALECRRGTGRLAMVAPAALDEPPFIRLEAGGEAVAYAAESEPSELHEGVFLVANASAADPVFRRFREAEWMTIEHSDGRHAMVPHPGSAARIERFFAFCG
ncbi:hypothetical protein [Brevundimonas sp.]|uniref:hypothetical protein n=1 Tax=Brevundimonas sp. TaxID=1871086 RepID=UPI002D4BDE81|nr:hypothetical protein [Brevundimonas sp.]HYC73815.1 hypothetical protein [Brevundimonas sp.]